MIEKTEKKWYSEYVVETTSQPHCSFIRRTHYLRAWISPRRDQAITFAPALQLKTSLLVRVYLVRVLVKLVSDVRECTLIAFSFFVGVFARLSFVG